ncbi:4a-hydroxytetrahydrobiopterin dehydratase [Rariglobus hedericola]|uniref:Putative pterin-4-alpha-carbinolamine dehydratase n=1 Tax=Rariglobus hedericola TaxID=2597822 RepID=A0A556QRB8_9BACT|nr:4a-hydroxytetrahydrobiopterin dehydratase [Rariglobus hedericola]TSJ79169.1 4a-hydroxytetrahydrobiopterin dehydratase [Rariglobus hedericola]
MKTQPLTPAEIEHALTHLSGWAWNCDALVKTLEFGDFREAMGFMLRAGFEADALDHHPEWTNVYNKVSIRLATHDAGNKVTAKDVELAGRMEKLRASLTGRA